MRKKLYILIISIISIITITTAFIPIQTSRVEDQDNKNEINKVVHHHPESGYIEEIGN